jgi:hypothetical protein
MPSSFEVFPHFVEADVQLIDQVNTSLARLRTARASMIERVGPLQQSKLAWKVATFRQSMLYRVVALLKVSL